MGWPVVTPSCAEQVVKSEAATKIQKAMRSFVWRRVFRGMVQQVQAAAQAKEEAAAKAVLKDKALSDLALFAKRSERKRSERNALALALRKRSERKARKAKAKAEKQSLANKVGAKPGLAVPQPEWSAKTEAACLAVQMAWRRHCARRQLVLKIVARADAMQDPLRARTVPGLPEKPLRPVVLNVEILCPRVACAVKLATKLSALPLARSWDVRARTWAELRRAYPQLDSDPGLARRCQRLAAAEEVIVEPRRAPRR